MRVPACVRVCACHFACISGGGGGGKTACARERARVSVKRAAPVGANRCVITSRQEILHARLEREEEEEEEEEEEDGDEERRR